MKLKLSLAVALLLVCTFAFAQETEAACDGSGHDGGDDEGRHAGRCAQEPRTRSSARGTRRSSSWMAPGADPMVMDGTSENRWVMGGRYLEQRFNGNFMGMPFEGIGYTGYDNVKKQYWGTWMDNMSTGMMTVHRLVPTARRGCSPGRWPIR